MSSTVAFTSCGKTVAQHEPEPVERTLALRRTIGLDTAYLGLYVLYHQ